MPFRPQVPPQAGVAAAGAPRTSGLPLPRPSPLCRRPARPAVPAADRPGPCGVLPLAPWGPALSPSPTPASPRTASPLSSAGPIADPGPRRLPQWRWRRAERLLPRGLQREERSELLGRGRDGADGGGADPPRPCAPGPASSAPEPAPDTDKAWARVPSPCGPAPLPSCALSARRGCVCPPGVRARVRAACARARGRGGVRADVRKLCACAGTRVPAARAGQSWLEILRVEACGEGGRVFRFAERWPGWGGWVLR